jgi:hypothetical protein
MINPVNAGKNKKCHYIWEFSTGPWGQRCFLKREEFFA